MRPLIARDGELRRRHRIPGAHEFAVRLQADVNKAGTCPFRGHAGEEDSFDEEETLIK
jgi:hypothetical protein